MIQFIVGAFRLLVALVAVLGSSLLIISGICSLCVMFGKAVRFVCRPLWTAVSLRLSRRKIAKGLYIYDSKPASA